MTPTACIAFICLVARRSSPAPPLLLFCPGNAAYKEAFASCLTLLFESARHDAGVSEITAVLEDASWPSDSIAQFTQLYTQHKDALRHGARVAATPLPALGSLSSTSFPSIIDVSWRVDDYLRSDALDQVRLPNYLVTLTTTNTAQPNQTTQTNQVPFACNFQQLQDLLAKLKDAQKQIQQRVE